jgi:outer membrane protein assembly factor BamB/tetratricopeptide (TPR) repeat protein
LYALLFDFMHLDNRCYVNFTMIVRTFPLVLVFVIVSFVCPGQDVADGPVETSAAGKEIFDLIYLAQVASANGKPDLAIAHLDTLLAKFDDTYVSNFKLENGFTYGLNNGPLHALCLLRKAEIYRGRKEPVKALQLYNAIVARFKDETMSRSQSEGIGWQMPVALQAMHQMNDMNDGEENAGWAFTEYYKQACDSARNPFAKVYATNLYAGILIGKGQAEEAVRILEGVIASYNDRRIFTYKTQVSHTSFSVALLYHILFNLLGDVQQTTATMDKIASKSGVDNVVANVARYFNARAKDNAAVPADVVVAAYRSFLDNASKDFQVTFQNGESLRYKDARSRFDVINGYWPKNASINPDGCKLFARADSTSASVSELSGHAIVSLQYPNEKASHWHKVKDENGRVGWVAAANFTLIETPFLYTGKTYSTWPIFDKNFKTQRHTEGKAIKSPVIRHALENVVSGRVIFFDVTKDHVPEVFVGQFEPLTKEIYMICIDGTRPEIRWRTKVSDCIRGKNGFVKDSVLYIGCYMLNTFSGEVLGKGKNPNASDELAAHLAGLRKMQGRYEPTYDDTSKIITFSRHGKKDNHEISAYDRATNTKLWTTIVDQCDAVVYKEISGDQVVVVTRSDRNVPRLNMRIFETATGALLKTSLMTNQLSYLFYADPIKVKDKLLMAASDSLHVFSFPGGNLLWNARAQVSSAALVGNTLYCISGTLSESGHVHAYHFDTGKEIWKLNIAKPITSFISSAGSALAINAGSTVYFIDDDDHRKETKKKGR